MSTWFIISFTKCEWKFVEEWSLKSDDSLKNLSSLAQNILSILWLLLSLSLSPTHLLNNLVYINTHRMETICLMMIWIILCSLLFFHISFDIMYYLLYAWFFILFVYFSLFVCTYDHPKDSLDSRPKDFLFLYWKNSNSEFISLQNPFLAFVLKSFSYN